MSIQHSIDVFLEHSLSEMKICSSHLDDMITRLGKDVYGAKFHSITPGELLQASNVYHTAVNYDDLEDIYYIYIYSIDRSVL